MTTRANVQPLQKMHYEGYNVPPPMIDNDRRRASATAHRGKIALMFQGVHYCFVLIVLTMGLVSYGCSRDPVERRIGELRRGDVPQRQLAAEELGRMGDLRAVEPLIAALLDEDHAVADAAAVALGRIGGPRAIQALVAAWEKPSTRWVAGEVLAGMGAPGIEAMIGAVAGADAEFRHDALQRLVGIEQVMDPRLVEPLLEELKSADTSGRCTAASMLGLFRDARAVEPLIGALADKDWMVRSEAAEALGQIGDPLAVDALLKALWSDDLMVRVKAAPALGQIGNLRALESLAVIFHGDEAVMRCSAAEGLGLLKDARALDILLAKMPNWEFREAVGCGLTAAKWKPSTERDQVYLWICQSDASAMTDAREQTCRVLLEDVKSRDKCKVDHAVYAFISLGWEDMISELKRILDKQGYPEMAKTYLNCGHDELFSSAKAWAVQHGYEIITTVGGGGKASWGSWK